MGISGRIEAFPVSVPPPAAHAEEVSGLKSDPCHDRLHDSDRILTPLGTPVGPSVTEVLGDSAGAGTRHPASAFSFRAHGGPCLSVTASFLEEFRDASGILLNIKSWRAAVNDSELKAIRHLWIAQFLKTLASLKTKVLSFESGSSFFGCLILAPGYCLSQS